MAVAYYCLGQLDSVLKNRTHNHHENRNSGWLHVFRHSIFGAIKCSLKKKVRIDRHEQEQFLCGWWQRLMMVTAAALDVGTVALLMLTIVMFLGMLLEYYHQL